MWAYVITLVCNCTSIDVCPVALLPTNHPMCSVPSYNTKVARWVVNFNHIIYTVRWMLQLHLRTWCREIRSTHTWSCVHPPRIVLHELESCKEKMGERENLRQRKLGKLEGMREHLRPLLKCLRLLRWCNSGPVRFSYIKMWGVCCESSRIAIFFLKFSVILERYLAIPLV